MSSHLEEGSSVSVDGTSIFYDEENGEYEIELSEATLISLDLKSKLMRIKIHSNKIQSLLNMNENKSSQNIEDEASDETDQELDDEDEIDKTISNIKDDIKENDDIKLNEEEEIKEIDPQKQESSNTNTNQNEKNNEDNNDNKWQSEQVQDREDDTIPDNQMEIIEMSGEEEENDDEDIKKEDGNEDIADDNLADEPSKIDYIDVEQNVHISYTYNTGSDTDNAKQNHISQSITTNTNLDNNQQKETIEPQQEENRKKEEIDKPLIDDDHKENNQITENIEIKTESVIEPLVSDEIETKQDNINTIEILNNNKEESKEEDLPNGIDNKTDQPDTDIMDNVKSNNEDQKLDGIDKTISSIVTLNVSGSHGSDVSRPQSPSQSYSQNQNGIDEYASDDEENDQFQDDNQGNDLKIEHNLKDPYLDELLTKQINKALALESEEEQNAEEYANSNEELLYKNNIRNKNDWRWALKPKNVATEWRKHAPTINLQNISSMTKSLKNITTNAIIPNIPFVQKQACSLSIDQCDCVQRLIFIMKYYSFWMKFKTETTDKEYKEDTDVNISEYYQSTTELIGSLKAYNRSKLLRDYLHIRHYHFNDDKLIAYIHRSQIPDCNDKNKMCKCITRNHQNKEIYKNASKLERRRLYWLHDNKTIKPSSMDEIQEINLQKLLDVIHSSFLHNAISNGTKFVTSINTGQSIPSSQPIIRERRRSGMGLSSLSSLSSAISSSSQLNRPLIIDAPNYEFGMKFDFHKNKNGSNKNYCSPKYPDLKSEFLNNNIHVLSKNDYTSIYNKADEYIQCDEGCKTMTTKRDCFGIVKGTKISIQHIIVIFTRCNYSEIERKFNMNAWMKKSKRDNNKLALKQKNQEIANWNKLLIESIICFGGILDDSQYIYHGINYKITFKDIFGIQFNIAISCTTQYSVAKNFANEHCDGICLKLGKMELTKDRNYMFDISDFSDYPNEREVLMFGDKLTFVDIVYDSLSHHDYVLSLKLYQQIIRGRWFTTNNDYHNKKHQRRIVKMIENMMINANTMNNNNNNNNDNDNDNINNHKGDNENENGMVKIDLDLGLNYIDPYIQSLFETITKNVLKKTIWINKESDTLLPELKTVFINDFIPFLKKNYDIKSKYAHVDEWIVTKKHLLMTKRQNPLKSKPFDHIEILNNDDMENTDDEEIEHEEINHDINENENDPKQITNSSPSKKINSKIAVNAKPMSLKQFKQLSAKSQSVPTDLKITFGFRCYKKYDTTKKQDMFKGEFAIISLPPQIESVKMLGGLWFPQIPLCKWDWCAFSNKKMSKGSSLFSLNQLNDEDELKIKICYQVKEVVEKVSLP